ncbi:anti-ECFsigma factor ChrR [Burkholderia lata]|uniref:Anti-ECFsigma factor ChrR n=1 Tax=Burkholderia lata (strain ATCC 17760 / DSM 23089 / LMG 22485 / NCIMB 9086 / R18194 / 383) TaxID=482957 RepID=A0A6P2JDU2_BURL3|nr:cupin domain-containing protein [Burkholderia lata]VWB42103.1 anti-ECFsigma factor ChrR [Burkholderia lata]
MLVNADFSRRVVVAPHQYRWVASPQAGVERVMLDRLGGEQARATSLVRYAPASCFPPHLHPEGEEILVLSGTFSEDGAHYPAGWYLRNPPGSSHRPSSREGAILFVKLRQMRAGERQRVRVDTNDPAAWQRRDGREICPLFANDVEQVCLQRLAPREAMFSAPTDGAEVLVLAGEIEDDARFHGHGSWMRLPKGEYPEIVAGAHGATVYLKTSRPAGMTAEA